jgi:ABC-type polysaccharide/polyol phosphate export permease
MYPVGILPPWSQQVAFLNPFLQIMQDTRHVMLGGSSGPYDTTAVEVYGSGGRLIPLAVAFGTLVLGLAYFRREGRCFAEWI